MKTNTTDIVYYHPPRSMFSSGPECDFRMQITSLYQCGAHSQKHLEQYISKHILQNIDGEKFSPQQLEWFWKSTEANILNFFTNTAFHIEHGESIKQPDYPYKATYNIVYTLLTTDHEFLHRKSCEFLSEDLFAKFRCNKIGNEVRNKYNAIVYQAVIDAAKTLNDKLSQALSSHSESKGAALASDLFDAALHGNNQGLSLKIKEYLSKESEAIEKADSRGGQDFADHLDDDYILSYQEGLDAANIIGADTNDNSASDNLV